MKKYGVDNPVKLESVKELKRQTIYSKHLIQITSLLDSINLELIGNYSQKEIEVRCKKCNNIFKTKYWNLYQNCGRCISCFPKSISNGQKEVSEFIKEFDIEVIENTKTILNSKKELDIYLPLLNIAIEYNGLYWHNEQHVDYLYHLNKTIECEKQNVRLIHIFSDEWLLKQEIVKARLRQILNKNNNPKIYERKCIIKEINYKQKSNFLNQFHIQGNDISKIYLGAFYNNELTSVMTFSYPSISKGSKLSNTNTWELNRFCSNYNYNVIGIASKLLSYFKRNYKWQEIFSYSDRRWSDGNLYYKLGFKLLSTTRPNYWYSKDGIKRIHRFNLRKKENESKNLSERILRLNEGYYRIWDCGNCKFILKNIKSV